MMRKQIIIAIMVGSAAVAALTAGCRAIRLPFGYTVNFPGFSGDPIPEAELSRRIVLPEGFSITTYAVGIRNARMLRHTPTGDLLVSAPREGKVYLLERGSEAGYSAGQRVLLDQLNNPHGLALQDDWLYVAETSAVSRVRFDAAARQVSGLPEPIIRDLPDDGRHWTRTIGIGPDGWLYVSVGSSCNVCIETDGRRAAIMRYHLDGSGEQQYATGLRNAVGFAWQPDTGALFATDNGRDLLGDDFPPCELNHIVEGGFYGWPFANGDRVPDPDYGEGNAERVAASIPPLHGFGAHTAPLGITFYTGSTFPARYHGAAFVAQHGSWNRSQKSGYQVVALFFDPDGSVREERFASGFEVDNQVYGRPVDVAVGPDGALYLSDDFTGSIYRITYGTPARARLDAGRPLQGPSGTDPLADIGVAERTAAAQRGQVLWDANGCAACHAAGHNADTYRPLQGLRGKYGIETLGSLLRTPQPPMPVFPLSDAERRDLAIYLLLHYG